MSYKRSFFSPFCLPFGLRFQLRPNKPGKPSRGGQADDTPSPEPVRPPKAGKPQAHCQGLAVGYYGLTSAELSRSPPLDALDLPAGRDLRAASSTFAPLVFRVYRLEPRFNNFSALVRAILVQSVSLMVSRESNHAAAWLIFSKG